MTARLGSVSSDLVSVKRGMPQGAPESPDIFTLVMDMVFRRLELTWRAREFALEIRRFLPSSDLLRGRCGACGKDDVCSGDDGIRNHPRAVIHCSEGLRGEDALDELPANGRLVSASGRRAGQKSSELCWIHGELGRKLEIRLWRGSGKQTLCGK